MEQAEKKQAARKPRVHTRLAVIGLTQCPELLRELESSGIELRGVADLDLGHEAVKEAMARGIYVTQDYTELLERPDVDLILNLIPDKTIEAIISQLKPDRIYAIHGTTASFLLSFFNQWTQKRFLLDILQGLGAVLGGVTDLGSFVGRTLSGLESVLDLEGTGIWILKKDRFRLYRATGLGLRFRASTPPKEGEGPFARVLDERTPMWTEAVEEDGCEGNEPLGGVGLAKALLLPMMREFEVKGVMALFSRTPSHIDKERIQLATGVADLLCHVMDKEGAFGRIKEHIIRDELTGLYNEVYFLDRLSSEIKRAARNSSQVSLLYMVLNGIKPLEPEETRELRSYLRSLASELTRCVRNVDVAARYRLHDFVLILPDTGVHGAFSIANRIMERISPFVEKDNRIGPASLSIGIACYPQHASQAKELLENAELSARLASREGENQIRVFPGGAMELDGLAPEAIVKRYPSLAELFEVLTMQAESDPFAFIHAREVARNAVLLAGEAGFGPQRRLEIGVAGWLHDLGKMALPSEDRRLRLKLLRLKELNLKMHPKIGAIILKNLGASTAITKAILYHHARYDGLGQPPKLKGEGIPIEGRILGVANAYQHLSREKGEMPKGAHEIFQALREMAGRQLDPRLVECMIRAVSTR